MKPLKSCLCPFSITNCRTLYKFLHKSIVFSLFFFSFLATSATENQIQLIQHRAERYVLDNLDWPTGGSIEAKAANLDNRIRVTDCPSSLTASSSSKKTNANNITVLIECPEENWRVYVPVRLTRKGPQVILTRALSRGQTISATDVIINMVDIQSFRRQGFSTLEVVIGAKAKKNLRSGKIIEAKDICVVCRNETVTIKAIKSGMTITTKGQALSDGRYGEQIKVKNSKSNRIIEARISGVSEVTVTF